MPKDSSFSNPVRPPFVIGVTGNMDPLGYSHDDLQSGNKSIAELKERLHEIFKWVSGAGGRLDPKTGKYIPNTETTSQDPWRGLGLKNTPILVLTNLAPGIDTLVAEVALEEEARPIDDPERCPTHIFVKAALPFPIDIYEQSSSFSENRSKQRLGSLLEKLRKQSGWVEQRDAFEVALDNDLYHQPEDQRRNEAIADLIGTDPDFHLPRRHLRYRAAGEYVAVHSDLLLAVYDHEYDEAQQKIQNSHGIFDCGSLHIVEAKRHGLSHELLAVSNNFAWADNGPVLRLPFPRSKNPQAYSTPGQIEMLYPYDLAPEDMGIPGGEDEERQWIQRGDEFFRRVLDRQEKFNLIKPNDTEEPRACARMAPSVMDGGLLEDFVTSFDNICRVRVRASQAAEAMEKMRSAVLWRLFILILFAALGYGCFEHWHNHNYNHKAHHINCDSNPGPDWISDETHAWVRGGILASSLVLLIISGLCFHRHLKNDTERQRYDYRALAEALRVQFYWLITGTGRAVSADYMQRQREEMNWIRYAVSSLAFPIEFSRRTFQRLALLQQHQLFTAAHQSWIKEQQEYFTKATEKREERVHLLHTLAWALAAGGLVNIIYLMACTLSPELECLIHRHCLWIAMISVGAGALLISRYWQQKGHAHDKRPGEESYLHFIFAKPGVWGGALLFSSIALVMALEFSESNYYFPDKANRWIIYNAALLLFGALVMSWSERNLYSEEARTFSSMADLYSCADRRLTLLLDELKRIINHPPTPKQDIVLKRARAEIQDIFYQTGCEALSENAEWLILHRARPLEPFMAG